MWPGRSFWKVDGRKRDCSILIGRTPVNVKLARKRKGQKSTGYTTAQSGMKPAESFQMFSVKIGAKKTRTEKEWKWQRGTVEHPPSGSQWNRGHFRMRKWESEHKSWSMPAEGPKGHVATDGLLAGERWQVVSMWLGSGTAGLR